MDAHEMKKAYDEDLAAVYEEVVYELTTMLTVARDRYETNKGTPEGLVAFGQVLALSGAVEKMSWNAARRTREVTA